MHEILGLYAACVPKMYFAHMGKEGYPQRRTFRVFRRFTDFAAADQKVNYIFVFTI